MLSPDNNESHPTNRALLELRGYNETLRAHAIKNNVKGSMRIVDSYINLLFAMNWQYDIVELSGDEK